jgi:hypothetical protein
VFSIVGTENDLPIPVSRYVSQMPRWHPAQVCAGAYSEVLFSVPSGWDCAPAYNALHSANIGTSLWSLRLSIEKATVSTEDSAAASPIVSVRKALHHTMLGIALLIGAT